MYRYEVSFKNEDMGIVDKVVVAEGEYCLQALANARKQLVGDGWCIIGYKLIFAN